MKGLKQLGLAGALASTLAFGGGCSTTNEMLGRNQQTWTMRASSEAQAAQGKVQVATDDKGNRDLKVEVKNIAPAEQGILGDDAIRRLAQARERPPAEHRRAFAGQEAEREARNDDRVHLIRRVGDGGVEHAAGEAERQRGLERQRHRRELVREQTYDQPGPMPVSTGRSVGACVVRAGHDAGDRIAEATGRLRTEAPPDHRRANGGAARSRGAAPGAIEASGQRGRVGVADAAIEVASRIDHRPGAPCGGVPGDASGGVPGSGVAGWLAAVDGGVGGADEGEGLGRSSRRRCRPARR